MAHRAIHVARGRRNQSCTESAAAEALLCTAPLPPSRGASAPLPGSRPSCFAAWRGGGGERNRTDDLLLAKQALSQLSYTPSSSGTARRTGRRQRRTSAAKAQGFGLRPSCRAAAPARP